MEFSLLRVPILMFKPARPLVSSGLHFPRIKQTTWGQNYQKPSKSYAVRCASHQKGGGGGGGLARFLVASVYKNQVSSILMSQLSPVRERSLSVKTAFLITLYCLISSNRISSAAPYNTFFFSFSSRRFRFAHSS